MVLSRDCDGCSHHMFCSIRFRTVKKNEFVYCFDGTAHLVDNDEGTI